MNRQRLHLSLRFVGVLASVLLIGAAPPAAPAPGDLDPTFDGDGIVFTDFLGGSSDKAHAIAFDRAGRIVVVGTIDAYPSDIAVARYNPDGSLDTTFDEDGKVITDLAGPWDYGYGVAVSPDGHIVVVGVTNYYSTDLGPGVVVRYNPDGSLDTSFGSNGRVDLQGIGTPHAVAFDAARRIVVAGTGAGATSDFGVARLNADGSLDPTFGGAGTVATDVAGHHDQAFAVTLDALGRIVAAGMSVMDMSASESDFSVIRYEPDGTLDASFGGDGVVTADFTSTYDIDIAYAVTVAGNGKILVAGRAGPQYPGHGDFGVARFNPDGALDVAWGGTGLVVTPFSADEDEAHGVGISAAGHVIVAGWTRGDSGEDFAIARYRSDGTLDAAFGDEGKVTTPGTDRASGMLVDDRCRIIVAGYTYGAYNDFTVARYLGGRCESLFLPIIMR